MSACVRNVFWFNSLFVLHILYIFHIFRLDHLTSTVPYFTHSPRMLWTRTCAVQTFRGRHQVLQSEGFRSGTLAQLCTTHVPKSMLLARWRSHCCAACVSPVSNNVQFPWAAFEPLWQLVSPSSFACIKNAETGGRTKM